ncbi:Serum response factor-binding protein 1 [Anthophora retusa]
MKKIELNNEIVLLRQIVRQARICVVNKLVREAKKLRSNHGNEKQLEKNKHKAEKLLREVFALKRIKDDEISRFGIINFENLQDILEDSHTDDGTRAMVKVVRYKSLNLGIVKIREKFPNYNEYISWKRKKRSVRKKGNVATDFSEESLKEVEIDRNDPTVEVHKERAKDTDVLPCVTPVPSKKNKKSNEKYGKLLKEKDSNKEYKVDKGNTREIPEIHITDVLSENSEASKAITKVISNEATVKRFVEILQETKIEEEKSSCLKETETQQFSNKTIEFTREMDDFFLNAHNAPTVSSIPMSCEEDIENLSNVDRGAFKSGRIRSKKGKLYNEKIGKANWNKSMQEMNNKNGFHNGDDTTETSIAYWKENRRKDAKGKERNIKGTNVRENESLHPSWAAKRKQQDILKQGFQGKKIKFKED